MHSTIIKQQGLQRKRLRIRKTVSGKAERPRLAVYRSEKHIYGQLIDDDRGVTLLATSSRIGAPAGKPVEVARQVGEALAEKALAAGITCVVFDRGGRRYAGRIAALAAGARAKGLQF